MQLKLKRTQRDGGIISKTAIFCLDARVEFTTEEQRSITRYKLQGEVIYTSEGARRAAVGSAVASINARAQGIGVGSVDDFLSSATGKIGHGLKAAALGAISAMHLTITINSLQRGQHIECKSLDELLGAEDAILIACENLKSYLDTALTFDGTEVVVDFATGKPQLVAQTSPAQQLIAPPPAPTAQLAIGDASGPAASSQIEYEEPQYQPAQDWTAQFSDFDPAELWNNPLYRKRLMIGAGVVFLLLLMRSCHIL